MKIAICVSEKDNKKIISDSLAKADYYLIVDSESGVHVNKIINSHSNENTGAEIFCSQLLISNGISKVICTNCEPDAKKLFNEANIIVDEKSTFLNNTLLPKPNKDIKLHAN